MSTVTTIGDRVKLKESNVVGLVRFIGEIKRKNGIFYGIELDEKKGKNDGSMYKVYYFKTEPKKGIFIRKTDILKTNSKYNPDVPRITVGDTVYVKKFSCNGTIRFIGSPEFPSKRNRSKSLANSKKTKSTQSLVSTSTQRSDCSEASTGSLTPTPVTNSRSTSNRSDRYESIYNKENQNENNENQNNKPSTPNSYRSKFATFALSNIWYGIQLSEAKGKNNGIVQGKWYFECKPKYGTFVRKDQIELLRDNENENDEKKSEYMPLTLNDSNWKRNDKLKAQKQNRHSRQRSRSVELTLDLDVIDNSVEKQKIKKKKKKDFARNSTLTPQPRQLKQKKKKSVKRSKSVGRKGNLNTNTNTNDIKLNDDLSNSTSNNSNSMSNNNKNKVGKKKIRKAKQPFNDRDDIHMPDMESKESEISRIEIVYSNYDEDIKNIIPTIDGSTHLTTIGDRVKLNNNLEGVVLFIGAVQNKQGIFYGIELDQIYANKGKNDGSFRGKYYFETKQNQASGLFVKKERINKTFIAGNRRKRVSINDRVYIERFDCNGTVQFIGKTEFKKGIWYGIQLEHEKGKNNGSVNGVFYFECGEGYGTFVKSKAFKLLDVDNNDNQSMHSGQSSFSRGDSTTSLASSITDLFGANHQQKRHENIIMDILMTENDLAGFCLIWMVGLLYVIYLRLKRHEHVIDTQWYSIIAIPISVCLFTWLFSYYITKYTKSIGAESMKIPSFYVPFVCKVLVAMIFFGRLMHDIRQRVSHDNKYYLTCDVSLISMWFLCTLSVITSEIMITTVMVNSILNLDQMRLYQHGRFSHIIINLFLFICRPILWVYNRLIVMLIAFHLYYYLLFAIGPICVAICEIPDIQLLADIGIFTLLLPFHNVLYLFEFDKWTNFTLSKYEDTSQTIFAVIQQVLIFTTIFDLLMDIWSIYLLVVKSDKLIDAATDMTQGEIETHLPQIIQLEPTKPKHLAVIDESQVKQTKYSTKQQLRSRKYQ